MDTAVSAQTGSAMTREEALEAAHTLVPALRARAGQCVENRQAPKETIDDLKRSGLLRLMQPKRYGGHELGWDVFCEVIQILAQGCGSQAWVYRVLGDHAKMLGTFPDEAQHDVWGEDIDTQASSSFAPIGKAVPVDGGYSLSGRFGFSSGIDHADWVILGGTIHADETQGHPQGPLFFLARKSEGKVIDDWFVNGLEGTGSKSFEIENAFVPGHRMLSAADSVAGKGPGTQVNHAAVYRLPRYNFTGSGFSALMVGMAKGLFADWLQLMEKKRLYGTPATEHEHIQIAAATCAAEIDAAERLYMTTTRRVMAMLEAGDSPSASFGQEGRRDNAYACQLTLSAINRIHGTFGASMMYLGNSIERQYRNILAASQHIATNWPSCAVSYATDLFERNASAERQ